MNKVDVHKLTIGRWFVNCYLISKDNKVLIFDPGDEAEKITEFIDSNSLIPLAIINTHAHYDHVGAIHALKEKYNIPFYLHSKDKRLLNHASIYRSFVGESVKFKIPAIDVFLDEVEELVIDDFKIKVFHTPGHTEGSVCFLIDDFIITGDTLMKGQIGRTDLPSADKEKYKKSLVKLLELPDILEVYAGHGENTTIGNERENNPAVKDIYESHN
ncbi:MAG: MBL fold metallo-hydrolase [Ignavibacteriae bacterium]|nr:MBL fold metallo-hydrolase [Ignavibacteriota bacterium]MCB9244063.1 MBL fold metallo-hydrolase [Ignavibacteriales bacterium]